MRKVAREEILDYVTYSQERPRIQEHVLVAKAKRRIHVGEYLTLLFENAETIRYQIQEMMRVEQIVKESDIQHEIDTYNEVLGDDSEIGCTLLIEIDEPVRRDRLLREWIRLPEHLYAKLEDGTKVYAEYDQRQVGEDRLSSVQYLKFQTRGQVPVALGSDLPTLSVEERLSREQREALGADLSG